MPFNISEFHGEISKRGGFAKTSNFEVFVNGPSNMRLDATYTSKDIERSLRYRVFSVDFPGRTVGILPLTTYGPPYSIGTMVNYVPITLSILLSPNMIERDYFLAWQDLIGGNHRQVNRGAGQDFGRSFDIGFYNDYAKLCTVEIRQFSETGRLTHTTTLLQCWPNLVSGGTGSWDSDANHIMQVSIVYKQIIDDYKQHVLMPDISSQLRERAKRVREHIDGLNRSAQNAQRLRANIQSAQSTFFPAEDAKIGGQSIYKLQGDKDAVTLGYIRSLMYKASRLRNF